jgi:hypothetical protein
MTYFAFLLFRLDLLYAYSYCHIKGFISRVFRLFPVLFRLFSMLIENIQKPQTLLFLLPERIGYRGLGSGIKRALEAWPEIDFNLLSVCDVRVDVNDVRDTSVLILDRVQVALNPA